MRTNMGDVKQSEQETKKEHYWTFLGNPFLGKHRLERDQREVKYSAGQAIRQAKRSNERANQAMTLAELERAQALQLATEAREIGERMDQAYLQARLTLNALTCEEKSLISSQIGLLQEEFQHAFEKSMQALAQADQLIDEANQMKARAMQLGVWAKEVVAELSKQDYSEDYSEDFSLHTLK